MTPLQPRPTFAVRTGLTLWLGGALTAWAAASTLRWSQGDVGLLAHVLSTSPAFYFLCICVHDGVHGVLARPRWLNQAGATALAMVVGLPFPLLQEAHLRHHQLVGEDDDPEAVIYGASPWQLPVRLPLVPWYYLRGIVRLSPRDAALTVAQLSLTACLVLWIGTPAALGWLLPVVAAVTWFGFTTVYAPHSDKADALMPWLNAHSGWHHDHHHDVRYPWPQYVQIRVWRFDQGLEVPVSIFEERTLRWLARPVGRGMAAPPAPSTRYSSR